MSITASQIYNEHLAILRLFDLQGNIPNKEINIINGSTIIPIIF